MGVMSGLIDAVKQHEEDKAVDEHIGMENMHDDVIPTSSPSTESFRQDVPTQGAPCERVPYPVPVQVKQEEDGTTTFTILMNMFDHPKSHIAIMQLLASASEEDTIIVNISNVGGFIYSVLSVAAMLKACKAKTVSVFSMVDSIEAVVLWLACKERRVAATPCMFIESIKYGNQGSVTDQLADSESTAFMQKDLLTGIVEAGIMTEEEATDFSKHETVFSLFGEPLLERLMKHVQ